MNPERIELNKKDAAGIGDTANVQQNEIIDPSFDAGFFQSPFDSDDYGADFYQNPVFDPIKISESGGQGQVALDVSFHQS